MKGKLIKKLCAVSLSALMLTGAGVAEIGSFISTSLQVSAATAETPASSFNYYVSSDGVIEITGLTDSFTPVIPSTPTNFFYKVNYDGTLTITEIAGEEDEYVIPSEIGGRRVVRISGSNDGELRKSVFREDTYPLSVIIPNSVTSIDNGAFYGCETLQTVSIPNSVTSIDYCAFRGCIGLTSIIIPDSVTNIGMSAFYGCTGLTSVTIPDSVTEIGSYAFADCTGLTNITIPDSVTGIDEGAFRGCSSLTTVKIPNNVSIIENSVFKGCTGLTSVVIPNSAANIGYGAFSYCTGLTSVTIPDSVTRIDPYAFYGCTGLTSINIPNGVTEIDFDAFSGCIGLTSITIPNSVTEIGSNAFDGCICLTSIIIPNSVTEIGSNVFDGCTGLTSVTIPNSVTSIGWGAFKDCLSLTSITIPNSVTFIGITAFMGCTALTSVSIGNNVNCIGHSAFSGCVQLTNVTIPDSVIEIGGYAFSGCDNLTIKGRKDSYAQTYAIENGIPFEAITSPLENESSVSANNILLGKSVTVTAAAKEGTTPYQYAVWYQNPNNKKWYKAQDYSTKSTVTVKPKQTGAYIIRVNVKDAAGKIKKKDFTVNVFAGLKNKSSVSAAEIKKGKSVTVTAASTGGLGEKRYAVWYKNPNNGKWYKAQGYSTKSTVTVKPKQTGAYTIRVNVKDERGKVVKKDYTVTVKK